MTKNTKAPSGYSFVEGSEISRNAMTRNWREDLKALSNWYSRNAYENFMQLSAGSIRLSDVITLWGNEDPAPPAPTVDSAEGLLISLSQMIVMWDDQMKSTARDEGDLYAKYKLGETVEAYAEMHRVKII